MFFDEIGEMSGTQIFFFFVGCLISIAGVLVLSLRQTVRINTNGGINVDVGDMNNYYGDIEKYKGKVVGILAAPDCTYFSIAGNAHKRSDQNIIDGIGVVDACFRIAYALKPTWFALENPVGKLKKFLGEPTFKFHPYRMKVIPILSANIYDFCSIGIWFSSFSNRSTINNITSFWVIFVRNTDVMSVYINPNTIFGDKG